MTHLRIGQGFDLHRLEAGRPFWLGGIQLDWPDGPVGHSDGDVVLHALIDAILGSTGQGDIGEHFPPGDAVTAGIASMVLLEQIWTPLARRGASVVNVDVTIMLEAPKLKAIKPHIQQKIATCLGVSTDSVAIKAKTMEGLGPIGAGEAVAAWVSVLLTLPPLGL